MPNQTNPPALGISGRIAAYFLRAQITPLLAIVALLLGFFAVGVTWDMRRRLLEAGVARNPQGFSD